MKRYLLLISILAININSALSQENIDLFPFTVFLNDYVKLHNSFSLSIDTLNNIEEYNSALETYESILIVQDSDFSDYRDLLKIDFCNTTCDNEQLQAIFSEFCNKFVQIEFNSKYVFCDKPKSIIGGELPKSTKRKINKIYRTIDRKISDEFRIFINMTWNL